VTEYSAVQSGELSVRVGDVLIDVSLSEEGWVFGKVCDMVCVCVCDGVCWFALVCVWCVVFECVMVVPLITVPREQAKGMWGRVPRHVVELVTV
jgi:hypothetical protein